MSRRLLALFVALVSAMTLVAGCGGASADPVNTTTTTTKSNAATEPGTTTEAGQTKESVDDEWFVGLAMGGMDATPTVLVQYLSEKMDALGWKYVVTNGDLDINKYMADMENLISQKPDFILARPMSDLVTKQAAQLAVDAGVPWMMMGISSFPDSEKAWLGDVGDPELNRGIPLGLWINDYVAKNPGFVPKIGFLVGDLSIDSADMCARSVNVRDFLTVEYEDVITAEADPKWSAQGGMKIMEDWLQKYPIEELNTILCWSDEMCVGVIQALQAAGKQPGDYLILSYDGLPLVQDYIKQGWISADSAYDLEKQATAMIEMIQLYKDGKVDQIKKTNYAQGVYVMDTENITGVLDGSLTPEYFDYTKYIK